MNDSNKPIRVAGDNEFGEKYHVAVALLRMPELSVAVLGPDDHRAVPFLSLLAGGRVTHYAVNSFEESDFQPTRNSTKIYCSKNWSALEVHQWRERIREVTLPKLGEVKRFLTERLGPIQSGGAALLWVRNGSNKPWRNSTSKSVSRIAEIAEEMGLRPILIGDRLEEHVPEPGNLIEFYNDNIFDCDAKICTQLLMFDTLMSTYKVCVSIGMKSGGMDGPGLFFGLPTVSFSRHSQSTRVRQIEATINNFHVIPLGDSGDKHFTAHSPEELRHLRERLSGIIPKS